MSEHKKNLLLVVVGLILFFGTAFLFWVFDEPLTGVLSALFGFFGTVFYVGFGQLLLREFRFFPQSILFALVASMFLAGFAIPADSDNNVRKTLVWSGEKTNADGLAYFWPWERVNQAPRIIRNNVEVVPNSESSSRRVVCMLPADPDFFKDFDESRFWDKMQASGISADDSYLMVQLDFGYHVLRVLGEFGLVPKKLDEFGFPNPCSYSF